MTTPDTNRPGLPMFRTDPQTTLLINGWHCLIGYIVILAGVPVGAGLLHEAAKLLLNDTGITRTAIGPALQYAEAVVEMLGFSYLAAWVGAIVSLPFVIWARKTALFGWGTAIVTGVAVAYLVLWWLYEFTLQRITEDMILPSAILGLVFWVTVRLITPRAFCKSS
ncbi:hypothetical protein [Halovulum sp. GXIMD14793]